MSYEKNFTKINNIHQYEDLHLPHKYMRIRVAAKMLKLRKRDQKENEAERKIKRKKKWRKEKKTEIDPALRELDSGERGHALDSNCTF